MNSKLKESTKHSRSGSSTMREHYTHVANVMQTKEYDTFHFINGNRPPVEKHVDILVESITSIGMLLVPILINEEGGIIDGQHRFLALQRLKLPVPYVIGTDYGIEEVKMLNHNQKNWSIINEIYSWADLGKKDYKTFVAFLEKYDYPVNPTYCMLNNTGSVIGADSRRNIKTGGFKVKNYALAEDTVKQLNFIIGTNVKFKRKEKFVLSMLDIMTLNPFDIVRMRDIVENKSVEILQFTDSFRNFKRGLQRLYNYRLSRDRRLRFWQEPI